MSYLTRQLSAYSFEDPLELFKSTLSRSERDQLLSVTEKLLLSCCYGMGIGTSPDLVKALYWVVQAGKDGNLSAILTSIGLYDAVAGMPLEQVEEGDQLLHALIERWKNCNWGQPSSFSTLRYNLHPIIPDLFHQTPAARALCHNNYSLREHFFGPNSDRQRFYPFLRT